MYYSRQSLLPHSSRAGPEWGRTGMKSRQTQESWGHGRNCSPQEVSLLHGPAQSWCCCIQMNKEAAFTVGSWTKETGFANPGEAAMVDSYSSQEGSAFSRMSEARVLATAAPVSQHTCTQGFLGSQQQRGELRYSIEEKQTINGRCDCVP